MVSLIKASHRNSLFRGSNLDSLKDGFVHPLSATKATILAYNYKILTVSEIWLSVRKTKTDHSAI